MTGTWWELMISLEKPKLTSRTVSTANTEPRVVSHAPTQCKDHTICLTQVALANMKAKTKKTSTLICSFSIDALLFTTNFTTNSIK